MFEIPPRADLYVGYIRQRTMDLINVGIWSGIEIYKVDGWLNNFNSPAEKYFSACILDSLIYRSEKQTIALATELIYRTIPAYFVQHSVFPLDFIRTWPNCLRIGNVDPGVRLVATAQQLDAPTKSTHTILRFLKRDLKIHENWIVNPMQMPALIRDGVNVFIFIDDFLGSGHQFEEVCVSEDIEKYMNSNFIAYAPLVAHSTGITYLNRKYPKLHICSSEHINEKCNVFLSSFNDDQDPEDIKHYYLALLQRKNIDVSVNCRFGYAELSLTYCFQHAAPDNSLPILWYNENGWNPLFNR